MFTPEVGQIRFTFLHILCLKWCSIDFYTSTVFLQSSVSLLYAWSVWEIWTSFWKFNSDYIHIYIYLFLFFKQYISIIVVILIVEWTFFITTAYLYVRTRNNLVIEFSSNHEIRRFAVFVGFVVFYLEFVDRRARNS